MMRNYLMGMAAVSLVIATPALARNSTYSGSFHSVEAKSSWSNGEFPKGFSLTITMTFTDDKLVYKSINDTDKAKPMGADWAASLDGTVGPLLGNSRFNQISVKQLSPTEFQVLELKDGDVIVGQFWTFSSDGKTLVRRGVGKSPEGKSKAFEEYFVRL